jgi:predicted HTH domain antitoxin
LLDDLRRTPEEFAKEIRLAVAILLYARGEISQGKGAELAGLSRTEFIDALSRERVDALQVDEDDLREEIERDRNSRR